MLVVKITKELKFQTYLKDGLKMFINPNRDKSKYFIIKLTKHEVELLKFFINIITNHEKKSNHN